MSAPKPNPTKLTYFNPVDANDAFAVHQALALAEIADPSLRDNEHWREQRDIAFARFRAAFEVM